MHCRLGSTTLSQLAFHWAKNPFRQYRCKKFIKSFFKKEVYLPLGKIRNLHFHPSWMLSFRKDISIRNSWTAPQQDDLPYTNHYTHIQKEERDMQIKSPLQKLFSSHCWLCCSFLGQRSESCSSWSLCFACHHQWPFSGCQLLTCTQMIPHTYPSTSPLYASNTDKPTGL